MTERKEAVRAGYDWIMARVYAARPSGEGKQEVDGE